MFRNIILLTLCLKSSYVIGSNDFNKTLRNIYCLHYALNTTFWTAAHECQVHLSREDYAMAENAMKLLAADYFSPEIQSLGLLFKDRFSMEYGKLYIGSCNVAAVAIKKNCRLHKGAHEIGLAAITASLKYSIINLKTYYHVLKLPTSLQNIDLATLFDKLKRYSQHSSLPLSQLFYSTALDAIKNDSFETQIELAQSDKEPPYFHFGVCKQLASQYKLPSEVELHINQYLGRYAAQSDTRLLVLIEKLATMANNPET